jgi:ElaB/YqjD/DUF883 family membrane-anchored ribosome-binding protein
MERNIDRASERVHETVDRTAAAAASVAAGIEQRVAGLYEKSDDLLAMKDEWIEGARDYVRANPVKALGMALAAGYLLRILTRSR